MSLTHRDAKSDDVSPAAASPPRPEARAGDVYSAEAARGRRWLEVLQVRGRKSGEPHALCRELLPSGAPATGYLRGVPRGEPFRVALQWVETGPDRGHYAMPARYRSEEKT